MSFKKHHFIFIIQRAFNVCVFEFSRLVERSRLKVRWRDGGTRGQRDGRGQSLTLPVRQVTVFGHAALLHAGASRRVVQVLCQILLRVLLLTTVAAALPVEPRVPAPTHQR